MTSYLRPDEMTSESEIKRSKGRDELIKGGLKTVAGIASTAIGARILPFLNEHIPKDLAIKGISKISPDLGNFLKKGMEKGLDLKEGFQFVKDQIQPKKEEEQKQTEQPKENRNIIQQYDPELHEYITNRIRMGDSPVQAGIKALGHERFKQAIIKIEKDHRTKISKILQSIYGGDIAGEASLPAQSQEQSQPQKQPQQEQQQQTQQGQPSQANQALMQALQAAKQARQQRQGQ